MTDGEYPDPLGTLFGERPAAAGSALPDASGDPAAPTAAAPPAGGFRSRREMRAAGGYAADAAAATPPVTPAAPAPATPVGFAVPAPVAAQPAPSSAAPAAAPPAKMSWRRRLSSAGVMAVVVGFAATATIPAFAEQSRLTGELEPLAGQKLEVTAPEADASAFVRDGYGTTSAADLRALYAQAIRDQNLAAYVASGAREMGDDYPWPEMLSRPQGGGLSPLNYYYRECVDFVAWRLNRDAGSTSAPFRWTWTNLAQGSAYSWKRAWENHGWATGPTPRPGAVAWFPGGNHVAYVSAILDDGSVLLEEYNYAVDHGYGQRVIQPGDAYYLYVPPS